METTRRDPLLTLGVLLIVENGLVGKDSISSMLQVFADIVCVTLLCVPCHAVVGCCFLVFMFLAALPPCCVACHLFYSHALHQSWLAFAPPQAGFLPRDIRVGSTEEESKSQSSHRVYVC